MTRLLHAVFLWYCGYRYVMWLEPERDKETLEVGDWVFNNERSQPVFERIREVRTCDYWRTYWVSYAYLYSRGDMGHTDWQPARRALLHKDNIAAAHTGQIRLRRTSEWGWMS